MNLVSAASAHTSILSKHLEVSSLTQAAAVVGYRKVDLLASLSAYYSTLLTASQQPAALTYRAIRSNLSWQRSGEPSVSQATCIPELYTIKRTKFQRTILYLVASSLHWAAPRLERQDNAITHLRFPKVCSIRMLCSYATEIPYMQTNDATFSKFSSIHAGDIYSDAQTR